MGCVRLDCGGSTKFYVFAATMRNKCILPCPYFLRRVPYYTRDSNYTSLSKFRPPHIKSHPSTPTASPVQFLFSQQRTQTYDSLSPSNRVISHPIVQDHLPSYISTSNKGISNCAKTKAIASADTGLGIASFKKGQSSFSTTRSATPANHPPDPGPQDPFNKRFYGTDQFDNISALL